MVSYTKWTSIVFDVAPSDAEASEVVSWAAARWRERKADIQAATVTEARDWAADQLR